MIRNKRTGSIIASKVKFCKTIFSQGAGLMFRKKPDYALIFIFGKEQIIPITMLFVFFPIDVLFLDESLRVVEIKRGLRPFTNYYPRKKAKYIVELPNRWARSVAVGDPIWISAK